MFGMGTGVTSSLWSPGKIIVRDESAQSMHRVIRRLHSANRRHESKRKNGQASRLISTGQLNPSPDLHLQPIKVVVFNLPLVLALRSGREI